MKKIKFNPTEQYGGFVWIERMCDVARAKRILLADIRTLIPKEFRSRIEWVIVRPRKPTLKRHSWLDYYGSVAWKTIPVVGTIVRMEGGK